MVVKSCCSCCILGIQMLALWLLKTIPIIIKNATPFACPAYFSDYFYPFENHYLSYFY